MLQYSLLHLFGLGLTIDDLKAFRQWGSLTPGHPEVGHTDGVEVTTGPLGQGVANSVGMAIAAKMAEARFATEDEFNPATKSIYAICSDGDLMEGISAKPLLLRGIGACPTSYGCMMTIALRLMEQQTLRSVKM